jgi:GT2 family glycosyltransferase
MTPTVSSEHGKMTKISVIIVNYNGAEYTISCLLALERQRFSDFEIIIVDNGSSDNSLSRIREFLKTRPRIHPVALIPLNANAGFAGGNAAALQVAAADYIALLNNDAEPDEGWLEDLLNAMEAEQDVGICASKMIVSGTGIIDSAGDGYATSLKGFKRGEGQSAEKYDRREYIFGACAGAALYRRKMLDEIGFFDEDFFLIQEDTDLNFRAQLAGWKVLYVPTALVSHQVRSTIGHMSDTAIFYSLRNSELVRIKNIPFLLFLRCLPAFLVGSLLEFLYFTIKHRRLKTYLRAKIDVVKSFRKTVAKRRIIMTKIRKADNQSLYRVMTPLWNRQLFMMKLKKLLLE